MLSEVVQERKDAKLAIKISVGNEQFYTEAKSKFVIPDTWIIAPLSDIAQTIVDCPHSIPKWAESGMICVRTNQFRPGYLDLSGSKYVNKETYKKRIERLKPQEGDILYSREGGILGVACRVPVDVELCLGQRMMLVRTSKVCDARYLELTLNSPVITKLASEMTLGGAAPRVNVSTVKSYPIPLPPLEEQNRIVAKVDQLMTLCDQLETKLKQTQTTSENLVDATVKSLVAA